MRSGVACTLLTCFMAAASAAHAEKGPDRTPPAASPTSEQPDAFPPPKSVRQSATISGRKVDYIVTVGSIPLKNEQGKLQGEVVYTSFVVPGRGAARPVTFSFNGGPGAASAFLNVGALGPKRIEFGEQGDAPSDAPVPRDNPDSWLDFTDLVFIDPIGTGYSRTRLDDEETRATFLTSKTDIEYLSRVVFDWLVRENRLSSRKYLIGESYGGGRVPRMAYYLEGTLGVGISGVTMLSAALDMASLADDTISPVPDMVNLPSMAAGYIERLGKPLSETVMEPIELYARTEFVSDLLAGPADSAATDRLSRKVAALTGLDPTLVRQLNGRVDASTFLRESRRAEGKVGSGYDSNITTYDPFPARAQPDYDDPLFTRTTALFTSAIVDLITNQVGWKVNERYYLNNFDLNRKFSRDDHDSPVTALRKVIAADPKMSATLLNGFNDFACPYFMSKLVLAQMPGYGVKDRVKLHVYPGGHMFYSRPESAARMHEDMRATYQAAP